jgi:hypothetical protein
VLKVAGKEIFNENFVGLIHCLPTVSKKLTDNPVVFLSAGGGIIFSEINHLSCDTDESSVSCLVVAVFGELFSDVGHWIFGK